MVPPSPRRGANTQPRDPPGPHSVRAGSGSAKIGGTSQRKASKRTQCNFTEGDKSLPLARRWPLGRWAVAANPHPNLATRRVLPCVSVRPGRGGAGQGREPKGERGLDRPYCRRVGSSPRLRRAARLALLPPAPPAPPSLPPRPPPPPTPPRSLIDGSLKKSPRSRTASAGELRHSRNPGAARTAQRPRAHGCSTPSTAHPPAPR